jgi:hypothetical protein
MSPFPSPGGTCPDCPSLSLEVTIQATLGNHRVEYPTGLKPTIRQTMIIVLWSALMFAAIRVAIQWILFSNRLEFFILISPVQFGIFPMAALTALFWALDRPGHVRAWYCSVCLVVMNLMSGILFLLQDPVCYFLTGKPSLTFHMAAISGLTYLWIARMQWQQARPGRCPSCSQVSVTPNSLSFDEEFENNGWCASCGESCEREGEGDWKPTSPPL